MTIEFEAGLGASVAPTTIFHKCAYNPRGVSRETCRNTTCVVVRNLQGCVATNCDSPERLCKQCIMGVAKPEKVIDPVSGLCAKHLEVAHNGEVYQQTKLERWQTMPDYASSSMLETRFRRDGVQDGVVVTKAPRAIRQTTSTPEEVAQLLKQLPNRPYEMALNIVHGGSVETIAEAEGVSVKAIALVINRLFRTLMLSKTLSFAARRELLWKGFEVLGITLPSLPPLEEGDVEIDIDTVPIEGGVKAVPLLTPKARIILALLADGKTNREIGVEINRSTSYVSTQVSAITETLDLRQYKDPEVRRAIAARIWKVYVPKQD